MKHYADIAKKSATVDLSELMPAAAAEFVPEDGNSDGGNAAVITS